MRDPIDLLIRGASDQQREAMAELLLLLIHEYEHADVLSVPLDDAGDLVLACEGHR